MTIPYDILKKTLRKGQLYWTDSGRPLTEQEVEEVLKDHENPKPNTVALMVPESMRPIFDAIQLQITAKNEGNLKLAEEIKQRLSEWLKDHPDIWARYGKMVKEGGSDAFRLTPEQIARARELARPIGPIGKLFRYFRGVAEAILNRREV